MPRYRLEYVHLITSARLRFTLETPGLEGMARGAGAGWLSQSGLHLSDFAFISVVRLGEDGHANTAEVDSDILSRVRNCHHGEPVVHEGMQVGRDDEREGTSGGSGDILPKE